MATDDPTPTTPPEPEKPRAKGKALPRSAGDIARMSEINDPDIVAARKDWKARAPEPYRGLIDAAEQDDVA